MSFLAELKRRHVFRVAAAYVAAGWLLTEVLTTVLPTLGAPPWVERAVVLVFALGFVPAVVFAWVYEVTPAGVRPQSEVDRDESLAPRGGRRLEIATLAAVVLGIVFIAFFGAQPGTEESTPAPSSPSIAVLPFDNMSGNPDNEYFSEGLAETLLHMLAQIPELKVAARTSSFAFRGGNQSIKEIAAALGVAYVLEGSVQRAGDRVRITAQLIRADDQFHVWSHSYDRTLDDIFVIQDEIAAEVGKALSRSLLGTAAAGAASGFETESADAYDLYLQALKERSTFSFWGLQAEEDLLKGALTIDPGFSAAKTALAYNYLNQVETGLMEEGPAYDQAAALTEQVLDVRPDDVDARAIRRYMAVTSPLRAVSAESMQQAIAELESLVAAHPDRIEARLLLVNLLDNLNRYDAARQLVETALADDPLNSKLLYELGGLYVGLGEWSQAETAFARSLEIEPRQPNVHSQIAQIRLHEGDGVGYVQQLLRAIEVDPADYELSAVLAVFLYRLGLVDEADDFRNRVRSIAPTSSVVTRVEMQRGIATGNEQALEEAARRAVEGDIADRQGAFVAAIDNLLWLATQRGEVEAMLDWIASELPGVFDVEGESVPLKYRGAQFAAFDTWYTVQNADDFRARLDAFLAQARAYGVSLTGEPTLDFKVLALKGQADAALRVALEKILVESALEHLDWRRQLALPPYADIGADPRVQARLAAWDEETAAVRERVREFFADLRAGSGQPAAGE